MLEHHLVVQGLRQWPPSTYSRMCAEDTAGHDHAVDSKVPQRLPDAQRIFEIFNHPYSISTNGLHYTGHCPRCGMTMFSSSEREGAFR